MLVTIVTVTVTVIDHEERDSFQNVQSPKENLHTTDQTRLSDSWGQTLASRSSTPS